MASDSIVGAVTGGLSEASKELLTAVIAAINGTATITSIGTSTVVSGLDKDGNTTGVLVSKEGASTGTINDGGVSLGVVLPEKVGLNFAGPTQAVTAIAATNYFQELIDAALPAANNSADVMEKRESLNESLELLTEGLEKDLAVRFISITNENASAKSSDTIKFSGATPGTEISIGLSTRR